MKKCCCCSLQAGVISIGVLGLIFPCGALAGLLYAIKFVLEKSHKASQTDGNKVLGAIKESPLGPVLNIIIAAGIGWIIFVAVVNVFFIIMNSLLIHGARLKRAGYLIPWLIWTFIPILLVAAQLAYAGVVLGADLDKTWKKAVLIGDLVPSLIFILINGFLWCCVFSFRQQIIQGDD